MLQPGFYSDDRPEYMNYGGIGATIGHEIAHGFDNIGLRFDKDGANQRLWSKEDMNEFSKRAQCFVDTISNITVPGTGGLKVLCTLTHTHTHAFFKFCFEESFFA
ncbi:neprilysin-11-like [Ruditapes philippinarum]|uniref:neprilysin-11-like n=1 Tax=Ruditapes philippinarum TaxID=129788 RepID=UPI00295A9EB8|nr:neprilysin-11-like [Ruditapes philippinarum]